MVQAVLAAIPSLYQMVKGFSQQSEGKRGLENLERPVYEIPDAAKQQLAISQAAYRDPRMPGEATAQSRIGQALSAYLRSSRDQSNPLAGLAMGLANTNRASNDLAAQSAQYQRQDQQNLQQSLQQYGQYQDQEWQLNKFAPYLDKYNEYREQIGAGEQNAFGGMNGLSSVAMQMLAPSKPIDATQVRSAASEATQAMGQDSFMTATGKMVGQKAAAAGKLGLTPEMLQMIIRLNSKI